MLEQILPTMQKPHWWKERTKIEQILLVLLTIMLLLIIILLSVKLGNVNGNEPKLCLTKECIKLATQILERVDPKVDPCEDFYAFACGTFQNRTILPRDEVEVTSFTEARKTITEFLRTLLEQPITNNDLKGFVLVKKQYQACMNRTNLEQHAVEHLKAVLDQIGGWFNNAKPVNWFDLSVNMRRIGFMPNMLINVQTYVNASVHRLKIGQAELEFSQYLRKGLNDPLTKAYQLYMNEVGRFFGSGPIILEEEVALINFIIELARITVPQEEARLEPSVDLTFKELEAKFPDLHLLNFTNAVLAPYAKKELNDVVTVENLRYFEQLGDLINVTNSQILSNYLTWSMVKGLIPFMNNELVDLDYKFLASTLGVEDRPPRWKECVRAATDYMPVATGALYVRNFETKHKTKTVNEMFEKFKKQFSATIRKLTWMDEATKKSALTKLEAITLRSTPNELFNDEELEQYYKPYQFDSVHFLDAGFSASQYYFYLTYHLQLDHQVKDEWKDHSQMTDPSAWMDLKMNKIEVIPSILQEPFFDLNAPDYFNYGGIGYIMAHELTHAFDDLGRQFDQNGARVEWWNNKTKIVFDQKAECFVKQYSLFQDAKSQLSVNGLLSKGENIADNGGVKLAFDTYRTLHAEAPELGLPGLNYTPEQLFWISTANVYCSVETREAFLAKFNALHPPEKYRINGALQNSIEFSTTFQCPQRSRMNPANKCHIW